MTTEPITDSALAELKKLHESFHLDTPHSCTVFCNHFPSLVARMEADHEELEAERVKAGQINLKLKAQLDAERAAAGVMRGALEAALADGDDIEPGKHWHGRLRHEVAVQCRKALAADAGCDGGELERLRAERDKLMAAIRKHHEQRADDRCWEDDDWLYQAAGLPSADIRVGDKEAMLANCEKFIKLRCVNGGWPTYQQLETELAALRVRLEETYGLLSRANAAIVEARAERDCLKGQIEQMKSRGSVSLEDIKRLYPVDHEHGII